MIQEVATAVIVLGAVAFLARRLFGGEKPSKSATTFVPIGNLKKKRDKDCH
ncbi:MAG: hypothetical protein ABI665_10680 [Vicinamibacterales bacterium]